VTARRTTHARSRIADRIHEFDDRFADNLIARRHELGVSRSELARRAGLPSYSIEKIETGHGCGSGLRRRVTIGEAVALAEALGVQPGALLKAADR
jgi:transcriptional regulator with XRE-family HTH domain